MKRTLKLSLCSLSVLAMSAAYADQATTAPTLEGGVTASLGTMYVVPSVANDDFATAVTTDGGVAPSGTLLTVDPDFDWGLLASLGYVFDNTANMVELSYRGLFDASTSSSASGSTYLPQYLVLPVLSDPLDTVKSTLDYEHHGVDLMFSQFMNLGEQTQIRFSAGVSYVDFEQSQKTVFGISDERFEDPEALIEKTKTEYTGFGPRVGIDGRYDFGNGFGIVAGGSAAYYLGDLDSRVDITAEFSEPGTLQETETGTIKNTKSDHAVTNLRGNVGIDYVYFLDNAERSTIGIELGYMADWYSEMSSEIDASLLQLGGGLLTDTDIDTHPVSFTGPYLLVKGAF